MAANNFLLILLFSYIISTNIQACRQTERKSLLSLPQTLSSPSLNWTSTNCCDWKGIACNQDGLVTHLLLPSKGLKEDIFSLSSSLRNLTHLTHLNLSHNSLYGSLGTRFFSSLNRLQILDLSYNLLSGELPLSLPSFSSIRELDLSSNHFHGAIPYSFFQHAWNLTSFRVSNNTFSGSIPSSLCVRSYSPFIRQLDFSGSATIPSQATELEEIALPFNSLYGGINDRITNLTNLEILDLSFNQLSGVLPFHFGKLSKLKFLTLDFNTLQGFLPPSLMNCTKLIELRLNYNNLEGDISTLNFSKLSHLAKLDLSTNIFSGFLPTSLYSCKSLKAIGLSSNYLEGQIQPEILSLQSLSFLALGLNRLTNIARAMEILMGCKTLRALILSKSFHGEGMPTLAGDGMVEFDGFQNLRLLSLSGCDLTGQLPLWLSRLNNLEILQLGGNRITGKIPSSLASLPKLFYINLTNNLLSGEFPKQLCRLPSLVYEPTTVQIHHYELELPVLHGPPNDLKHLFLLPVKLSNFAPTIAIDGNTISGHIPTEIGQLQNLHGLVLSRNNFSGNIPEQISNLKSLEALSLEMNHLSGEIPSSLTSLNFLNDFNVSYNNLQGIIPTSTQLQSFDASAFEGNPKLCGPPLPHTCRPNKDVDADDKNNKEKDNGHDQFPWFLIFVASGFAVGFWGVCGSLLIKKTWRYAYFRFTDSVQDRLYVIMTVRTNRFKRWLRG